MKAWLSSPQSGHYTYWANPFRKNKVISVHAMKKYGGSRSRAPLILKRGVVASCRSFFTTEKASWCVRDRRLRRSQIGLDAFGEKRKKSLASARNRTTFTRSSGPQPNHYTDRVISARRVYRPMYYYFIFFFLIIAWSKILPFIFSLTRTGDAKKEWKATTRHCSIKERKEITS